ncbi:hypothetical protein AY599_07460 [Leptolyngbya valderiana BDU 20041]|uniref:hypothetical protein n=1 Tax=Baaleninema simplex TaxID=2862350 RepID=UPI00034A493A|nr:hypothetical protein [Baaleninema simplex]MDC0835414.1 hypothetical protein [Geitlerinema sp. CS-897]OAB62644.1 hypothetical protein AY599_07460 [Leptolyngbya valderiana BDU 20041]PPT10611.1 hypothetical protein CKA32_004986 [Geitlerinema sp. FC II]
MQSQYTETQLTFSYENGHEESFSVPMTPQEVYQQLQLAIEMPLLTFHLYDRSVTIRFDRVLKVEVFPPFPEMQGDGVFSNAQVVTAMRRAARR